MKNMPPMLIARALKYFLQGHIHFDRSVIGKIIKEDDDYEVFRKIVLDRREGQPKEPGAIFRVTFNFANMSISTNKKLSLIPIPFIVSQEGFRSKTWMIGKNTGRFQGYYECDTVGAAQKYWNSLPMKLMKRRSTPESLHYEIHAVYNKAPA